VLVETWAWTDTALIADRSIGTNHWLCFLIGIVIFGLRPDWLFKKTDFLYEQQ
jgi:hypothetical protein